jgi:hypothetical protein
MQFLIYRPNSPSSPHHREKKMLTTLNNLTFDSHTPLSVQRNSYSLVFNPLSIPTKSYMRDRFSIESILFLRTLYRRPALQHSYHLYAPSAIRDAQYRKAVAPGGCAEANQHSNPEISKGQTNSYGGFRPLFGAPGREIISGSRPASFGNCEQRIFFGVARALCVVMNSTSVMQ